MAEILEDLSSRALTKAIQANRIALTPCAGGWPGAEVLRSPALDWCVTDSLFPACNVAFGGNLPAEEIDSAIANFIARGQARKVPLQWWCDKAYAHPGLEQGLLRHGFEFSWEGSGMALELKRLADTEAVATELAIERVEDDTTLATWCQVAAAGFAFPAGGENEILRWSRTLSRLNHETRFFLGRNAGRAVATSLLFPAEGVAGLYFIATLSAERRKGFGSAMTRRPLQLAREAGYRAAILHASEYGFPIYRSLGFQEYSRMRVYVWSGTDPRAGQKEG